MKTIAQALLDEIHYPIPHGFVENKLIERGLDGDFAFSMSVAMSNEYKGALADCLYSLIQSINFSEADKSIGALSTEDKKIILRRANALYSAIGEDEKEDGSPVVYIIS